jgi:N-acetylmuramoyl-L-alanine amidase
VNFDQDDVRNLALCAWKEARGEGIGGVYAVMHVICNRVNSPGFPKTVHDVIYQKNAFTSMSVPSDPEFNLEPPDTDPVWRAALADAPSVLGGDDDPTLGARYYANLKNVTSGWFTRTISGPDGAGTPEHPFTVKIGKHSFYK